MGCELVGERLRRTHNLLLPTLLRHRLSRSFLHLRRNVPTDSPFIPSYLSLVSRFESEPRSALTVLGESSSNHGACGHQAVADVWLSGYFLVEVCGELAHGGEGGVGLGRALLAGVSVGTLPLSLTVVILWHLFRLS